MPRFHDSSVKRILYGWDKLSESHRNKREGYFLQALIDRLRELPSQKLLQIVFASDSDVASHPLIIVLRKKYLGRKHLLNAIYRNEWQAIEANYVRLPSAEKRYLDDHLVKMMKKKFRWFSSKLLHAYAFKPNSFRSWDDQYRENRRTKDCQQKDLCANAANHPLYQRVQIPRLPGRPRTLHVPTPPLKHLQGILLDQLLNPIQQNLPACVMGCRKDDEQQKYGVIANAASHVGQAYIASFDLKDFFPSVHVSMIIEALMGIDAPMLVMREKQDSQTTRLCWTHDSAVLVARLATRYGRLPQGSPTSPAIANLVFSKIDKRLLETLGHNVVYTRYVDDLTFSISHDAAQRNRVGSSRDFQALIQPVLRSALTGSQFKLNDQKTHASSASGGHVVTGFSVGESQVNLPREKRRQLRGLIHQIANKGFVEVAESRLGAERYNQLRSWTSSFRDQKQDKSSASGAMLRFIRTLCPKLAVEVPEETYALGGKRIVRNYQLHEGRHAALDCMFMLPYLWNGEIEATLSDGHLDILRVSDGQQVASIRAERNVELIALPSRQFHASLDLWMRLQGWVSGLHPPRKDSCFGKIEELRATIYEAIHGIRIRPVARVDAAERSVRKSTFDAEVFSLHPNVTAVAKKSQQVHRLLDDLAECLQDFPSDTFQYVYRDLSAPADDLAMLRDWIAEARHVVSLLPMFQKHALEKPIIELKRTIQVMSDRLDNSRRPTYQSEQRVISRSCKGKNTVEDLTDTDSNQVQLALLDEMTESLSQFHNLVDNEKNVRIKPNPEQRSAANSKAALSLDRLLELHAGATWRENGKPIFVQKAHKRLRGIQADLSAPVSGSTTDDVWEAIEKFAQELVRWTTDSLSYSKSVFSQPVKNKLESSGRTAKRESAIDQLYHEVGDGQEILRFLFKLRNRGAHGLGEDLDKEGESERRTPQKYFDSIAAKYLGKRFGRKAKKQLQLSQLEGTDLKVQIVHHLCNALSRLQK